MSNQKQQQKPGTPQQGANPLQNLKELKESLGEVPGAGAVGGLGKVFAKAKEMFQDKRLTTDDIMRALKELKSQMRSPSSPNLVNRAKGGMVKKKKPKKAGRLAKRGYGAARK